MMALHRRNALRIHPNEIPRLATILYGIGFADTIFQDWRIGQRFGLSRPLTSLLEWHIRGFADGALDSEVEISRRRLQHLCAKPGPYYEALVTILKSHSITFYSDDRVPPDASYICLPEPFGEAIPIQVPVSHAGIY